MAFNRIFHELKSMPNSARSLATGLAADRTHASQIPKIEEQLSFLPTISVSSQEPMVELASCIKMLVAVKRSNLLLRESTKPLEAVGRPFGSD